MAGVRAKSSTQYFQDLILEEKLFTRYFQLPLKVSSCHCQTKNKKCSRSLIYNYSFVSDFQRRN